MKMISALSAILALTLAVTVQSEELLKKTVDISNIDSIELQGPGLLTISQDGSESLEIIASSNVMSRIEVNARGTTLRLRFKEGSGWNLFQFDSQIHFKLSVKNLNKITTMGSGDVELSTDISSEQLRIESSGSGDLRFKNITAKTLKMSSAGSGDFSANDINADRVELGTAGSGDMRIAKISASEKVELNSAGSGDIRLDQLNTERFELDMAGSGDTSIKGGEVIMQNVDIGGSGDYSAARLKSKTAQINVSGSADAKVWVTDELEIDASGASDVQYYGQPRVKIDTSGASDVKSLGREPN